MLKPNEDEDDLRTFCVLLDADFSFHKHKQCYKIHFLPQETPEAADQNQPNTINNNNLHDDIKMFDRLNQIDVNSQIR